MSTRSMRGRLAACARGVILSILCLLGAAESRAECAAGTGNNATVLVPAAALGQLQEGDVIEARFDGLCVGQVAYVEGRSFALTVWGDDPVTEAVDGIPAGETIDYVVRRPGLDEPLKPVVVRYQDEDTGAYAVNGIYYMASFEVATGTFTEAKDTLPATSALSEAYPNPFNPQTTLTLQVKEAQRVVVEVFDVQGRLVRTLHQGYLPASERQTIRFDAGDLASGVYVVMARGERFLQSQRVVLLK